MDIEQETSAEILFQTTTQRPSITFSPEEEFGTSLNSLFAVTTPTPLVTTTVPPTRKEVLELIGGATEVAQISDLSNVPGQMQGSERDMQIRWDQSTNLSRCCQTIQIPNKKAV